jgi:hypothetical protein
MGNDDAMAETEEDSDKRGCAADEWSRGDDEKEMVKETRQSREPATPTTDLEGK